MLKHGTSSVFVFAWVEGQWRLGLIEHPRLAMAMIPGGHIEDDETAAHAAWREVREETGLQVRLVSAPSAAVPQGYPHPVMDQPWWITVLQVPRDNHVAQAHVHIDHVFVAIAESIEPLSEPEHPFAWWRREEVLESDVVFEDTRVLAEDLFARIEALSRTSAG